MHDNEEREREKILQELWYHDGKNCSASRRGGPYPIRRPVRSRLGPSDPSAFQRDGRVSHTFEPTPTVRPLSLWGSGRRPLLEKEMLLKKEVVAFVEWRRNLVHVKTSHPTLLCVARRCALCVVSVVSRCKLRVQVYCSYFSSRPSNATRVHGRGGVMEVAREKTTTMTTPTTNGLAL